MATLISTHFILQLFIVISFFHISLASRKLSELVQDQPSTLLQYHNGPLLWGKISVNLIWYGKFKPSQRVIISDFLTSFTPSHSPSQIKPSVATIGSAAARNASRGLLGPVALCRRTTGSPDLFYEDKTARRQPRTTTTHAAAGSAAAVRRRFLCPFRRRASSSQKQSSSHVFRQ